MSVGAPPRQRLSEYFLEINLTKRKHIVVEGRADRRFLRAWLDDLGEFARGVVVVTVESLDVPMTDIVPLGLNDSHRSRVIVVAAKAAGYRVDLRCVADRDCGQDVENFGFETLLWTDYPAMESYVVERRALDKANLLNFGGFLPSADELLDPLAFALGELFAVRRYHLNLPKPNYKAGLKAAGSKLSKFDVKLAVEPAIRPAVDGYERPSSSDPRDYAYGHDVGELLLAAYGNVIQNKAGLTGLAAVEGALRSAIQAAGTFVDEPLFTRLAEWIGEVTYR